MPSVIVHLINLAVESKRKSVRPAIATSRLRRCRKHPTAAMRMSILLSLFQRDFLCALRIERKRFERRAGIRNVPKIDILTG